MARLSELQGSCSWDGPIPIHESMGWMELQFEYLTKCTEYPCFHQLWRKILFSMTGDVKKWDSSFSWVERKINHGRKTRPLWDQTWGLPLRTPKYKSQNSTSEVPNMVLLRRHLLGFYLKTISQIRQDHFLLNATHLFWPQIFLTISSYLTWIPESNTLTTTTRRVWLWRYSRDQNFFRTCGKPNAINHPQVITIVMGGMSTIQSW